jgi:hypothetical protein
MTNTRFRKLDETEWLDVRTKRRHTLAEEVDADGVVTLIDYDHNDITYIVMAIEDDVYVCF